MLGYSEVFNQRRCFSFPLCSPGEINFPTFLVPLPSLPGPSLFSVGLTRSTVAMNPSTSNDSFSRRGSRRPLSRWITRYVKRVLLPVPLTSSSLSFVGRFRTVPDNQRNPIFVQQYRLADSFVNPPPNNHHKDHRADVAGIARISRKRRFLAREHFIRPNDRRRAISILSSIVFSRSRENFFIFFPPPPSKMKKEKILKDRSLSYRDPRD